MNKIKVPQPKTTEEYNVLYANTLCYLISWEKKFIYMLKASTKMDNKQAYQYLNILKQFIKDLELIYSKELKKFWFYL